MVWGASYPLDVDRWLRHSPFEGGPAAEFPQLTLLIQDCSADSDLLVVVFLDIHERIVIGINRIRHAME